MTTLLQINASINNGNGESSRLANQFVAAFHESNPKATIVVRDVAAAEPVPHLNAERFGDECAKPLGVKMRHGLGGGDVAHHNGRLGVALVEGGNELVGEAARFAVAIVDAGV